jgi:small subunit ribosomal protein S18
MPRKTNTDKSKNTRGGRSRSSTMELRTPRPKPKVDFTVDALDFKNVNLLKQFVTDQGRLLPRKYTGLPAHYQRRLCLAVKRARQMLLMK